MQSWIVLLLVIEEARLLRAVGMLNLPRLLWTWLLGHAQGSDGPERIAPRSTSLPDGKAR
jgi:hypothetical protein